jgi:hypothetical protein
LILTQSRKDAKMKNEDGNSREKAQKAQKTTNGLSIVRLTPDYGEQATNALEERAIRR